jgi:hypothetical protein
MHCFALMLKDKYFDDLAEAHVRLDRAEARVVKFENKHNKSQNSFCRYRRALMTTLNIFKMKCLAYCPRMV